MGDAGAVEHEPLRFGNRTLIADRQRDQHTGVGGVGQRSTDALADRLSRPLHVVARAPGKRCRPGAFAGMRPHVAGGAQIALEQPRFEVESAGVDVAVRAAQPHDEPPALTRAELRRGGSVSFAAALARPRERDPSRHHGSGVSNRSTANAKRSPCSDGCGRSSTTPTISISTPSHAGGSASARRTSARHAA